MAFLLSVRVLLRWVEPHPLRHALPNLPFATSLPQLHCSDNGCSLLITNVVDLTYEIQVLVTV